jgi:hypothetical protein
MGNQIRGFTEYGVPILNDEEVRCMRKVADKYRDQAVWIHGYRAMSTLELKTGTSPTTSDGPATVIETMFGRGARLAQQFAKPYNSDKFAALRIVSVNFVYTLPGSETRRGMT